MSTILMYDVNHHSAEALEEAEEILRQYGVKYDLRPMKNVPSSDGVCLNDSMIFSSGVGEIRRYLETAASM